jgi:hypothetical protein
MLNLQIRQVEPEWLDQLDPDDQRAQRSRRDLRRINRWMNHAPAFVHAISRLPLGSNLRILDLGGGDGSLLLEVASRLHARFRCVQATLVDRVSIVSQQTIGRLRALGWNLEVAPADAIDWLTARNHPIDVCLANLFLHHFKPGELPELLTAIARRTSFFMAAEPRRCVASLASTYALAWIGCHRLTRYDARVSVRAGFRDLELTGCWPTNGRWHLSETRLGLWSHRFTATQWPAR